jgi:hypothetical protein
LIQFRWNYDKDVDILNRKYSFKETSQSRNHVPNVKGVSVRSGQERVDSVARLIFLRSLDCPGEASGWGPVDQLSGDTVDFPKKQSYRRAQCIMD